MSGSGPVEGRGIRFWNFERIAPEFSQTEMCGTLLLLKIAYSINRKHMKGNLLAAKHFPYWGQVAVDRLAPFPRARSTALGILLENSLEMGFVGHCHPDVRLIHHRFKTETLALILAPQHPWAGRKVPVKLTELTGQSFLISKKGSGTWRLLSDLFTSKGIVLKDILELGTTEGAKQAVAAGLGISIVSRHALGDVGRDQLREVPLESEGLNRELYFVYCKDRYLVACGPGVHCAIRL
jgi:DNA-binding transcriptional LysR family regulator